MKIEWGKVYKEYKKLGVPKEYYNPCNIPFNNNSWFALFSERSIGKTTNCILLGLVLNKLYGIQVQYIRETSDMLAPKNMNQLCAVIQNEGYISKLTNNEYNTITYHARKWKYAYFDYELNKVTKTSDVIISCLSISENFIYKSSYNAPYGDFIIFDECVSKYWYANEFIDLCDLIKTIGRDREDIKIILLANTIDPYAPILDEIEAQSIVENMDIGQSEEYLTEIGTPVYIELCGNSNPKRKEINKLFYGFKNPRLKSITGGAWAMSNYPHNCFTNYSVIDRSHFIRCNNHILVQLELCKCEEVGMFVNVHKATRFKERDVVWTTGIINTPNERYMLGYTKFDKFLVELKNKNLWFYSSNMIGTLIQTYFRTCDTLTR